jgi:hypothetical protein
MGISATTVPLMFTNSTKRCATVRVVSVGLLINEIQLACRANAGRGE